ncbi:MAG: 30S ribosomal protein S16 [Planctomycetes bacterium]|nr:30S ribosomal protein S16 [Planctomycetota bacterium]
MVKLRLTRTGRRKLVTFRLVACDSRSPRDGRFIEVLGNYNPRTTADKKLTFDKDRVEYWIGKGAQPTLIVWNLLRKHGINKKNTADTKRKLSGAAA